MSESNRVQFSYVKETVWGTTPSAALQILREVSGAGDAGVQTVQSQERRADRLVSDNRHTGNRPTQSSEFEFSYSTHDDLLEGAMFSTWTAAASTTATDITPASGPNTFTTVGADFVSDGHTVGEWVRSSGWTSGLTANNAYFRITVLTTTVMTVEQTVAAGASGDSVTIKGSGYLRNGVTANFYSFEEAYLDLTNIFMTYLGGYIGSLAMEFATESIITGTIGDIACKSVASPAATIGTGYTVATTTEVMTAVTEMLKIYEGGISATALATSFSFALNNNLRPLPILLQEPLGRIDLGTVNITGNYNVLWGVNAQAIIAKLLAETSSSLAIVNEDGAGNAIIITFPAIDYISGVPERGALDTTVMSNLAFVAKMDTLTNTMMQIDRIAA